MDDEGRECGRLCGVSTSTERRQAARTLALVWLVVVVGVLATGWLLTGPLVSVVDPWDDSVVRWLEDHRTSDLDAAAAAGSAIFFSSISRRVPIVMVSGGVAVVRAVTPAPGWA